MELAALRPAASVTLLSPAGLWRGDTPLYCRVSLRVSRWVSRHGAGLLAHVVKYRLTDHPGAVVALITGSTARGVPNARWAA